MWHRRLQRAYSVSFTFCRGNYGVAQVLRHPLITRTALAVLLALCINSVPALAQQNRGGYPTVIGASGQPYGPTQAEYQYQQRYGHPSPGNQGGGMQYVNGYPAGGSRGGFFYGGYNPYLYMDIGPYITPPTNGYVYYPSTAYYGVYGNTNYGFPYAQPYLGNATPQVMQPLPPAQGTAFSNGTATFTQFPTITNPAPVIPSSSPKAVETSFEYQTQGDLQLQQLNYLVASERYRKAIDAARDRADPRYRMAISLAARSRFLEAVDQLKLAVQLDPTWPQHASSLNQLFGEQNTFEKTRVKQRVAEWTLQDARDPNRLFLLGVMLYMDGDSTAKTMIDTAILIAGRQDYLVAFTMPRTEPVAGATDEVTPGNAPVAQKPQPPVPRPPQPQLPGAPLLPQEQPIAPSPIPVPAAPATNLPFPGKPIPAIPPLPEGTNSDAVAPSTSAPPAPTSPDELTGPILPPLP